VAGHVDTDYVETSIQEAIQQVGSKYTQCLVWSLGAGRELGLCCILLGIVEQLWMVGYRTVGTSQQHSTNTRL
jgi:hypothetical protein